MRAALFVLLACTLAQPALHTDTAPGVVKGRLVFGDTGAPAARVTLRLLTRGGTMAARTDTSERGEFRFSVRPGVYRVSVQLPAEQAQYLTGTLGAEGTQEEGLSVRVRSGGERVLDYALKPGGALGGRVLDPDGRPLKDGIAFVAADPRDNDGIQIETGGSATIDADGRFLISGLAPGMYRVTALAPEKQEPDADGRVTLPTYFPNRIRPAEAQPVAVGAGDRFDGLTMTMARGMMRSVSGRVIDPDGSPAAHRALLLRQGTPQSVSGATGQTDEQGRFTVIGLTAGPYDCMAVGRGSSNEWGSVPFELGLEDIHDLVVQIRPAARLTGHVEFDETPHPAGDMRVWTSRIASGPAASYGDVKPDGSFAFILSATRKIDVQRVPDGWFIKAIWINGANVLNTIVDAQFARSPVRIVLSRRMARLSGHVDDAGETDTVLAIADDPATWTPGSSQLAVADPDERGDFRFDHLVAGAYRLAVVSRIPSGFREANDRILASLSASGVPVRLTDGETQQVTLKAPGAAR